MNKLRTKRIICTHEETIKAPLDKIFPLLCPVEELKWIDNWQYQLVYTDSGVNENNCIFREDMSGTVLFNSPVTTMWITTLHDPDSRIQFVLISGEMAVIKFDIELRDQSNGISFIQSKFTYTPLKEVAVDETTEGKLMAILALLAGENVPA
ncbi:MAG: hypothetical protein H8D87_18300 [Deltaproteobacteria bacterium]|uniref:hypothetical protein n=1 Tax=Desulfobacula sp. TaxID=2593537 RepID=UPI001993C122|nr:hypothetical protein [Candidatus Desulfobacula maris]MBL6995259.1 hypothetical protein [Desulfobacula sp.]